MRRSRVVTQLVLAVLLVPLLGMSNDPKGKPVGPAYRVPYRLSETLHIIVRAKLNGKGPFNFIVDTGAPAMFVTTAVAKTVGVELDRGWATFERMELEGGAPIQNAQARVEDIFQIRGMNAMNLPGVRLDGVLGYNILAKYRMEFDLSTRSMTWTDLNFEPGKPRRLFGDEGASAPPELEWVGGFMQGFGQAITRGKPAAPSPRGFIGIELATSDETVRLKSVLPDSPAAKANLAPGDVIVEFAGKPVRTAEDVVKLASGIGVNEDVCVRITRHGDQREVVVKTASGF